MVVSGCNPLLTVAVYCSQFTVHCTSNATELIRKYKLQSCDSMHSLCDISHFWTCVHVYTTATTANTTIQQQKQIQERRTEGLNGRMDTLSEMIRGTTGGDKLTDQQIQDQVRTV
jgi:hypothetical protein